MNIFVCSNRKYDSFLKNKKCKLFNSLDECIKQKPDIAFITNTTNLHVKTAIKLANANILIFIEKPLSNSTKEVKLLLDTIKKRIEHLISRDYLERDPKDRHIFKYIMY